MAQNKELHNSIARLSRIKDAVEGSLGRLEKAAGSKGAGNRNINLATRVNKAVVANIDEPNSAKGASSKQSVAITQDPGGTREVSETTEVSS